MVLRKLGAIVAKGGSEIWTERVSLAICLWLCALPLVVLLAMVVPYTHVGWIGAVVSFVVIFLTCMAICTWRVHGEGKSRIL
jgi:hypothetical protein